MLSNGNILFTRQTYIAEVTPDKKVVWRYDPPVGNEIHICQPIGLDKVMFAENGLPPNLRVVNIKTKAVEIEHDLVDQLYVEPSFSPQDFSFDIRPELRSQIADQIEPECYRTLDQPEPRRIEAVRVPHVGKNG